MSRGSANQFLVNSVANVNWCDFDWWCRSLAVKSGAANKEETLMVIDITSVARSTFAAIADPHAYGSLFVGGETAPVGFTAYSASSVFGNSTKAVYKDSLPLRKVDDLVLVGRRNMN